MFAQNCKQEEEGWEADAGSRVRLATRRYKIPHMLMPL